MMGGIPASLGGGGLEMQRDRTAEALARTGVDVFHVAREAQPRAFDVLHCFGSEIDVCHQLTHWRRNPAPLVITPVLVVSPGREEHLLRGLARVPFLSVSQRQRAMTLRRADLLVAVTNNEARLLRALAPGVQVLVVDNGVVDPKGGNAVPAPFEDSTYALLLGTVSRRKRQQETVEALRGSGLRPVVVGGFDGDEQSRRSFELAVADAGGAWLGEIDDPALVSGLVRSARVLVHMSVAEGQSQAVLEALAVGTPVVCAPIPPNVELRKRYAGHVHLCDRMDRLAAAVSALPASPGPPPEIPTWDDVAAQLRTAYIELLRRAR